MSVAIQGQVGSFHDMASQILCPEQREVVVPKDTFRDVFEAVDSGEVEHGLVAVENNIKGPIVDVSRLWREFDDVWITHSLRMYIGQNLVGYRPFDIEDVKKRAKDITIISHDMALGQVDGWVRSNMPEATVQIFRDTAGSVERVMEERDPNLFAIAGKLAVQTHEAHIIAPDIQDEPNNYTIFCKFQKGRVEVPDATHGSMILTTDHRRGALLKSLAVMRLMTKNLDRLDSHPIPNDKQHYDFHIDYELAKTLPGLRTKAMVAMLRKLGFGVRLLGEYVYLDQETDLANSA